MSDPAETPANIFESFKKLAQRTRELSIYHPGDIEDVEIRWSEEDLLKPERERGKPVSSRMRVKPESVPVKIQIRSLSASEMEACERILDAALPQEIFVEEGGDRPGTVPRKVRAGYDYDAPEYAIRLRPLEIRRKAMIVLYGVLGLAEGTGGNAFPEKAESLVGVMGERLIDYISREILSMTYAVGGAEGFFTSGS